jgi:hypothetical protein
MKTEVPDSSKTLVLTYQTAGYHIPEHHEHDTAVRASNHALESHTINTETTVFIILFMIIDKYGTKVLSVN